MLIVADPARRNRGANPYNALLSDALTAEGHEVLELQDFHSSRREVDVLHVHWPDWVWGKRYRLQAYLLAARELMQLTRWRLAGTRVVWTAHNAWAHNRRYARAERLWWRFLERRIDGWIGLSEQATAKVLEAHPRLAELPHAVIAHGHYRQAYAATAPRTQLRRELGITQDQRAMAFVGRVKPYKGVAELVKAFAATPGEDLALLVAGLCVDPALEQELRSLDQTDERIRLRLAELTSYEMADVVTAADLIVLPYRNVLNSGTALLALSLDTPVLLREGELAAELAAQAPGWVHTFNDLTPGALQEALEIPRPLERPALDHLDWPGLARQTVAFYREVLNARS